MRVEVDLKAPVIPKQKWYETEVVVSEGNSAAIDAELRNRLSMFNENTFNRVCTEHKWTQLELDAAFSDIVRRIGEVRTRHRVVVTKMMPTMPGERQSPEQRQVNFLVNKISRTHQGGASYMEHR